MLAFLASVCPVSAALAAAPGDPDADPPDRGWEGAIGLLASQGPEYPGSDDRGTALRPALFLRYGRVSVSSGAGFAVRHDADLWRGLGLDLTRRENLRISLGLRFDNGRSDSDSPALAGMGDVRKTVRLRGGLQWQPARAWRVAAAWTVDAFGRGGGNLGEISVTRDHSLSSRTTLEASVRAALAGRRYMQTYYGVNEAQSARTGYPVFEPGTGWRDVMLSVGVRHELNRQWVMQAGASVTQLIGGAADSPLTRRVTTGGLSAGLAYRF